MDDICPHLGALSDNDRRQTPVEFPSFENLCLASGAGELILLGDQATYCFSREHQHCPRFRRAQEGGLSDPATAPFVPFHALAEETWSAAPLTHVEDTPSFEPLFGACFPAFFSAAAWSPATRAGNGSHAICQRARPMAASTL